jgi:nondiscriminating glutamyl-tRNA synthetase
MRTRFPPSPTGLLHIGGLRTALYCWLVAKKTKDAFTLRIEDTDRAREVPGAVENIVRTLMLSGLTPDEGVLMDANGEIIEKGAYGPYFQSKRLDLYQKYTKQLLDAGHAYHCFCTAERLEQMRKKQQERKQAPMYDRTCVDMPKEEFEKRLAAGEKCVIRMKVPHDKTITYSDAIYGNLTFKGHLIDDQVLVKSDGFPTYHLAHVVDDHLMKTDLVIRGEEWLSSLPKHLILFEMIGWTPPAYAHVPLLLNKDRTKLSKRQNDVAAEDYLKKGYLPEALLNFLALLGWNPGTEQELFSLPELIDAFSIDRVHKSGAVFDLEKLDWIQGQWMRKIPASDFAARIRPLVGEKYPTALKDADFEKRAALIQERITFFTEAPDMMSYLYETPALRMDIILSAKQKVTEADLPKIVSVLKDSLSGIDAKKWSYETIVAALEPAIAASGLKKGQVLWPLRAILTGREYSPGAYEVATLLGKEESMKRLNSM